jgi:NAD(P)-dependent dehydrogenase (short-subunit alcohol dehydrogenase family)
VLKGKTIIVTGAGSGIGRASAEMFAASGANIVVADLDENGGRETVKSIEAAGGTARFTRCDVSVEDQVAALVAFAVDSYGGLHGALNNAGIEMRNKPVHELTAKDWQSVIDVDLTGVFYCIKHEVLYMKDHGGGSIVNTASASGLRAIANTADYTAAKHGVIGLTKAAAIDGGPLGIRVNAVCPGVILTPMMETRLMNDPTFSQAVDDLRRRHYIGRFGKPADVAEMVMWLLSDRSTFVTGTASSTDGGYAI